MAISNLNVVGWPFALGAGDTAVDAGRRALDAGFGRFFVGVTLQNNSSAAWLATEVQFHRPAGGDPCGGRDHGW